MGRAERREGTVENWVRSKGQVGGIAVPGPEVERRETEAQKSSVRPLLLQSCPSLQVRAALRQETRRHGSASGLSSLRCCSSEAPPLISWNRPPSPPGHRSPVGVMRPFSVFSSTSERKVKSARMTFPVSSGEPRSSRQLWGWDTPFPLQRDLRFRCSKGEKPF